MLPESYLSPLHLPFNRTCLEREFEFLTPDQDPGGEGFWILLRGSEVAVQDHTVKDVFPFGRQPCVGEASAALYIGQWQDRPCRVVALDAADKIPKNLAMRGLTRPEPQLSIEILSLSGLARQVLYWHGNSRFCSRCGCEQDWISGGWGKLCPQCNSHHFPHIHPCVIVVIRRPGEILMTRKADWPEGRYSLVAGFLDMGECLEEAVVREVREETGVGIRNIRYIGSQSWPFPCQLMTGFTADYVSGAIRVEEDELEDVRWFPVDDLPLLPPKRSISRYLIDNFKEKE